MVEGRLKLVLAVPSRLIWDSLVALIKLSSRMSVVGGGTTLCAAIADAFEAQADVAILGASFPGGEAFTVAQQLLTSGRVSAVGILDYDPAFGRARRALGLRGCTYLTCDDSLADICDRLIQLNHQTRQCHMPVPDLRGSENTSSPNPSPAQNPPSDFLSSHLIRFDRHGLFQLTQRELQVLAHLASGKTIRATATEMGLSPSTIDNHKNRMTKKLGRPTKAAWIRIAIEAGLVE